MLDRVPTKPNRYAVYDDAHNFLRYEYHERADEPTQEGTPLGKASFLSDATEAAIWGAAADRTVDAALCRLSPAANQLRFIDKFIVEGAYTWTCPEDGEYLAVIMGGGGGGAAAIYSTIFISGGASGFVNFYRGNIAAGENIAVVVGAGGTAASITNAYKANAYGGLGGTSSFNAVTAAGGGRGAGEYGSTTDSTGPQGAQGAFPMKGRGLADYCPMGGMPIAAFISSNEFYVYYGTPIPLGLFNDENGLPITMLCAGGGKLAPTLANGKLASPTSQVTYPALPAVIQPTDCGAGGGDAGVINSGSSSEKATFSSAPGAPGGVFIYKIQEVTA